MKNPALIAAVDAGKASALATRLLGRGGGTALPGLVARAVYPGVLRALTRRLPEGSVLITGTNGKTTTARMLGSILDAAGLEPLHNRSGSNLERGVIATMVEAATPLANLPARYSIGLFEVDEAAMPGVLASVRPRVTLLNNLFRDQLDRYGELETIYRKWRDALPALSTAATLALNADDPGIAALASVRGLRARTLTFGIEDSRYSLEALPHAADSISCPRCGGRLEYSLILLGHLGHWHCPHCGLTRPEPEIAATRVALHGTDASEVCVRTPAGEFSVILKVPGLYNVYNGLAAIAVALALGASPEHIRKGLSAFTAAFGRIERVGVPGSEGKSLLMALVKNPVGFNEVLRMLFPLDSSETAGQPDAKHLLIIINDLIADGRDVSWLWDVDFEVMASSSPPAGRITVSGIRAADMAVRLKYAGIDPSLIHLESDTAKALDFALESTPGGETLYVLPTYTAMMSFRSLLYTRGWVRNRFWEQ